MASSVKEIILGLFAGVIAGLIGWAIDLTIGAYFESFGSPNLLLVMIGVVYVIVSFSYGMEKAYYGGIFFSVGIILAGLLLRDSVTVISGLISLVGIAISLFRKKS